MYSIVTWSVIFSTLINFIDSGCHQNYKYKSDWIQLDNASCTIHVAIPKLLSFLINKVLIGQHVNTRDGAVGGEGGGEYCQRDEEMGLMSNY